MNENAILTNGMTPGEAGRALYRLAEALESEADRLTASATKARRLADEYEAAIEGALEMAHHNLLEGWTADKDGETGAWVRVLQGGGTEGVEDNGEEPPA